MSACERFGASTATAENRGQGPIWGVRTGFFRLLRDRISPINSFYGQ